MGIRQKVYAMQLGMISPDHFVKPGLPGLENFQAQAFGTDVKITLILNIKDASTQKSVFNHFILLEFHSSMIWKI